MKTEWGKKMIWQVVVVVAAGILTLGMVRPDDASAVTDACKLLSVGEIEAVVGGKVNRGLETPEMCQMGSGTYFIMITRLAKKDVTKHVNESNEKIKKEIEKMKKMGVKMTEEKYGTTTCSTAIGNSRTPVYTTGCTVDKGGFQVDMSVIAVSEAQMVPSAKVRLLVEKAAARL